MAPQVCDARRAGAARSFARGEHAKNKHHALRAMAMRRQGGGRAVAAAHEQAASGRATEAGGTRRLGASRRRAASTRKRHTTRPAAGSAAWQMRQGAAESSAATARISARCKTLRHEARRRRPLGARTEHARKGHLAMCARACSVAQAARRQQEGSEARSGSSALPRSRRLCFKSSRHKARRCRQAARRAQRAQARTAQLPPRPTWPRQGGARQRA